MGETELILLGGSVFAATAAAFSLWLKMNILLSLLSGAMAGAFIWFLFTKSRGG